MGTDLAKMGLVYLSVSSKGGVGRLRVQVQAGTFFVVVALSILRSVSSSSHDADMRSRKQQAWRPEDAAVQARV